MTLDQLKEEIAKHPETPVFKKTLQLIRDIEAYETRLKFLQDSTDCIPGDHDQEVCVHCLVQLIAPHTEKS